MSKAMWIARQGSSKVAMSVDQVVIILETLLLRLLQASHNNSNNNTQQHRKSVSMLKHKLRAQTRRRSRLSPPLLNLRSTFSCPASSTTCPPLLSICLWPIGSGLSSAGLSLVTTAIRAWSSRSHFPVVIRYVPDVLLLRLLPLRPPIRCRSLFDRLWDLSRTS